MITIIAIVQVILLLLVTLSEAQVSRWPKRRKRKLYVCRSCAHLETTRKTKYGYVRGQIAESRSNSSIKYYSFIGIPYGRPPVGKLRFQESKPPKPWSNVRETLEHKHICLQFDDGFTSPDVVGSEDCLYLDVYIPITARGGKKKMPVMVWIHGGNWVSGGTYETGPDYFMEKPVVIVEIRYRLNVFGFLTTLDENAKGNLGLKDQVLALQWIRKNIKRFDGDRKKVTIFGVSAGGASIFYHMMSPLSKGLFARGISESGSPLNTWAVQRHPVEKTLKLAKLFGIDSSNTRVIVDRLQQIDAETLFRAAFNYSVVGYFTPYDPQPFSTIIERKSKTAFISQSAFDLLKKGKFSRLPLMMGINSEEGSYSWGTVVNGRVDVNIYQRDPQLLIPPTMNIPNDSECVNKTLSDITQRYFPGKNYTNKYEWLPYMSLNLFVRGILETGRFLYGKMPVYFYYFTFMGSRPTSYLSGVGHMEELEYLFYPLGYQANPNETESDKLTRRRMITLWTNFASTGNPTPRDDLLLENVRWPVMKSFESYLNIGFNLIVEEPLPYQSDMTFWDEQYATCGFPDPNPNNRNIIH